VRQYLGSASLTVFPKHMSNASSMWHVLSVRSIHAMQTDNGRGSIALVPDLQHFAAVQKLLAENK
jgi:hypothetical protein